MALRPTVVTLACALAAAACTGTIADDTGDMRAIPAPTPPAPAGPASGAPRPAPPPPMGEPGAGTPAPPGAPPTPATAAPPDLTAAPPAGGGNTLDPAELTCRGADQGATPARLVRLGRAQYEKTIAALGAVPPNLTNPFTYVAASDRYSTTATSYTMTDDELVAVLGAAESVAAQLVGKLKTEAAGCVSRALAAAAELPECARATVARVGQTLFRRPLSTDEIAAYARLAIDNQETLAGGREAALSLSLQALLAAPDFLYRVELGEGPMDAQGRRRLGPWELASAISFTLADAPPDATLQAAARDGKLNTADEVRAQVTRYAGTPEKGTPRFFDFMREYLGWDRVPAKDTVAIDRSGKEGYFGPVVYGPWDVRATVRQWLATAGRKEFWRTALGSNQFVIRGFTFESWDLLRSVHEKQTGVKVELEKDLPYTFPAEQRAGFLSMPTFMLNLSTFTGENLVVQRGRWIRENLLCRHVPELPIGTVPSLPEGSATLREKLQVHSTMPGCAGCHQFMDPLGLVFEGHDDVGRTRKTDHGKPVDESGALVGAGALDGPVVGIPQLAAKLAAAPEVELCFVRQNLRYLLGRNEQAVDACTLARAQEAYRAGGGDYVALLVALLTSDSFLYRRGVKP